MIDMPVPFSISVFILTLTLLSGCNSDNGSSESSLPVRAAASEPGQLISRRDSVIIAIESANSNAFKEAFVTLAKYDYTRYTRTEQFDDDEFLIAFLERSVRHAGSPNSRSYAILSADSTGEFDFGYFRRFVSSNVEEQDPEDLTPYLFPEDPSYLSSRNFEAYTYRFFPDSLMGRVNAQVVEVRARPVEGDGKNIRKVRYYIDETTNELIAFELNRIDLAFFFREESHFFVHLQKTVEGHFIPYNTRFETRILVPFRPPQLFRTVSTYFNIELREEES